MPKIYLIYLKSLLDLVIVKFFEIYNDCFSIVDNRYVLSKKIGKTKLLSMFKRLIFLELQQLITKYDRLHPNYYFIIGSCLPKNNLLLNFKDDKYFPKKLSKLLSSEYNIKYLLKEKDIDINILQFNDMCIELANQLFCKDVIVKTLGAEYKNVMFIQHSRLDCYTLFKVLKYIYGKSNCTNIFKDKKLNNKKQVIIAINDLIDKYVNKAEMNKSEELKTIVKEIEQYIQEKIQTL